MTKARNTFEGYQKAKQESRESIMVSYLKHLTNSRLRFQHVTGLADMVAKHISHQQQKPCSKSTLLRNNRYKALLLTFMAAHLETGTKNIKLRDKGDERANALVISAQLEAANLKRESARLKAYIIQLERNQQGVQLPVAPEVEKLRAALHDITLKYTRTCQALFTILKHFGETLSIEADRQLIIDMSKLRNNVVVETTVAAPFFEWLRQSDNVPGGANE